MSSITQLAAVISDNTATIERCLAKHAVPPPSWSHDAEDWLSRADCEELNAARDAVLSATMELRNLILGPRELLQTLGESHNQLLSLHAIYRFGIATRIPVGDELLFTEIADSCSLNEHVTRRLIRYAMLSHIFYEPRPGVVAHTAASRLLAEDEQIRDFVGVSTEELWQAASRTVDALQKWTLSEEPNETGFALANNTSNSVYLELAAKPERAKRFANSMGAYSATKTYSAAHVVSGYDWAAWGSSATVVDIGGSHGSISLAVSNAFPELRFVVQDLSEVIANRPALTPGMEERVRFMSHDFLEPQPVHGADVYYFRWIFHGWADKYCVRILQALIPALRQGARILINDYILPKPGEMSLWKETRLRTVDMSQMEMLNTRERELDEWKALFRAADARFRWIGAWTPSGSALAFIEAYWEAQEDNVPGNRADIEPGGGT